MEKKDTVIIACESQENRQFLRLVLSERFNLLESVNIQQMLSLLEQNLDCVATLVIGTSAIDRYGQNQMDQSWEAGQWRHVPVVVFNETKDMSNVAAMIHRGAADVIGLHEDAYVSLHRVETVAQLYMHRQHMEKLLQDQSRILRRSNETLVDALSSIIEYRSAESGNHVMRIRQFVRILLGEVMNRCPEYQLTPQAVEMISSASALHDVGKVAIPDAILLKPGALTDSEWEIMKTHALTGRQILDTLQGVADQEYLRYAKDICWYHHERWDGGGYPEGLAGDDIPIWAQVVGLADAYEALTAQRVYKEKYSFDQAINMILKGECGAFSPKLLACLKNVTEAYETLTNGPQEELPQEWKWETSGKSLPEAEIGSLERVQAMYYCLVHYINGFLVEINLDMGLFHVVYNPYPELANLENITTLGQLSELVLDHIVVPQERSRMQELISKGIPRFVDEDLRRASYRFHHQGIGDTEGGLFEATLLRVGVVGSKRRSLAILFRKLNDVPEADAFAASRQVVSEYDCICRNDRDFTLVSLRSSTSLLGGYTPQELWEKFGGRLAQLIHPEDRERIRTETSRQLKQGSIARLKYRVVQKDGSILWISNRCQSALGEDGQENLYCLETDITQIQQAYEDLLRRNGRYVDILSKTNTVLFRWDTVEDVMKVSETWERVFGNLPPEKEVRQWLVNSSRVHPDDVPLILDRILSMENGSDQETQELRIASDRGRYIWHRLQVHADRDARGRLIQVVGVVTNIEAEKQKEQVLRDRADRDSLTKLLNKDAARKRIAAYLGNYPQGASCAMLIIDLDDFKAINDTYGHLFGDAVLAKVAKEIKGQFKGQDIVSRIGGDEFLVMTRGLADRRLLEDRCRQLLNALSESLKHQQKALKIGCSIGIALGPDHGNTYQELFSHADQALYRAKAQGKNSWSFYDPAFSAGSSGQKVTVTKTRIDSDEEPGLAENSIVRHAFNLLYKAEDVKAAINRVIEYLGRKMNVSRVYIFENTEDNRHCNNTFEWCNEGIEPQIQYLQNVSYEEDIPGFLECFNDQGLIYSTDIRELPGAIRDILETQGILSVLLCAIQPNGVLRGYIGFDECIQYRLWTREEIQMLTYFAEVLSTFLIKVRRQEKLTSQAQDTMTILENQSNWIYIIDPDTWELCYMNKHAQEYNVCEGMDYPCYKTIRGFDSPCSDCPARDIRQKKTDRLIRRQGDDKLLFEATMIRWEGKDRCLVTGRPLPKEV